MITLSAAVGVGEINNPADLRAIQEGLNRLPEIEGRPHPLLTETECGPATDAAIKKFQWRQILPPRGPRELPDGIISPGGATLRHLNNILEGREAGYQLPREGPRGVGVPLLFTQMWDLIQTSHTREVDFFPPELLIGLFWEETNFVNRRGIRNPRMLGFGQVKDENVNRLRREFGLPEITPEDILGATHFNESVEIASLALVSAHRVVRGGLEPVLHYYATGDLHGHNPLVNNWLHCMERLQALRLSVTSTSSFDDQLSIQLREILWRDNHVIFSPDLAFP